MFSGTVIESGYLVVRADRIGEDTTFARILKMVEDAQDKKAKTQKFLEKFSRYYTPAIIILSIALFLATNDLVLALTLLVIACPGALVISTPVSIVAGIGNGAKHGILVKGGEIMEKLGAVKVVAFDKTGTLTVGKPSVTRVEPVGMSEDELLRIAAVGESYSEHPLGKAIISTATKKLGPINETPEDAEIFSGHGLRFSLGGKTYFIGNRKLFTDNGISVDGHESYMQSEERKGQTAVIVGTGEGVCGIISIADTVRSDARSLVLDLESRGISRIVMLTGDSRTTAEAVADRLGIDEVEAEVLPDRKAEVIRKLQQQGSKVAMTGDGVNDAPALAQAEVGIAMGSGTDVAMESAGITLVRGDLNGILRARRLSQATLRNIRQNLFFAFFYNLCGVPVAAGVLYPVFGILLSPMLAAAAMSFSSVSVVTNALRLRRVEI